jgi:hypothetical protein
MESLQAATVPDIRGTWTYGPSSGSAKGCQDGKADVIWHNATSGTVAVWLMNGGTVTALGFPGSAPTDWEIQP